MGSDTRRPMWWKILFGLLAIYGCLSFYGGIVLLLVGSTAAPVPIDRPTYVLAALFLPFLLFGLWRPKVASTLLFCVAAIHLALTPFSHQDRNDPFGPAVPDSFPSILRDDLVFLILPALGAGLLLQWRSKAQQSELEANTKPE
jgi:hypothetical protein